MKLPPTNPRARWVETARKLRVVRRASLQFLDRWAIGHLLSDVSVLDRVAGDIHRAKASGSATHDAVTENAIADHANRDWSILYRGSVLDD
jgi:hypothetical protein